MFGNCLRARNSDMRGHVGRLLRLCRFRTGFNIFPPAFERKCLRASKRALVFSKFLSFFINSYSRFTHFRCSVLFKLFFRPLKTTTKIFSAYSISISNMSSPLSFRPFLLKKFLLFPPLRLDATFFTSLN